MVRRLLPLVAVLAAAVALPAFAQGQLNLYCSSPNTAWCQGMAVGFEKATGTKVAVIQKATGEMLAQIKAGGIVDARTPGEHFGEAMLKNKKAGCVPGAVHLEWVEFLDPKTDKFLPPADLIKLVKDRKVDLDKPNITYCQGGGRAAVAAFGLELAGAKNVRNYYASWGEWGNDPDTPVEVKKK